MSREKDIIKHLARWLPRSKKQINQLFESDSEIIQNGSNHMLVTIDEFSQEDLFRDHNPHVLGWNLAVATISDILACGGLPKYYGHSVMTDYNKWDANFLKLFSCGIADVLKLCNAFFIGGDVGSSDRWHYTGFVIGEAAEPLTRLGAIQGDSIMMTGQIGMGNLEAALKLFSRKTSIHQVLQQDTNRFSLRLAESRLIRQFATACIDTSDGILNAVMNLAELNQLGFELNHTPYLRSGEMACRFLSKPKELLLMGECGEYELVFTLQEEDLVAFLQASKANGLSFTKIGSMKDATVKCLKNYDMNIDFQEFDICARDFQDVRCYLEAITNYLEHYACQ